MIERNTYSPGEVKKMDTQQLRDAFLVSSLMQNGKLNFVYSHFDRMIIGGIVPAIEKLHLEQYDALKSTHFLERREMGIINIGGEGTVMAGDESFTLNKLDCLYLGRGTENISFASADVNQPAAFFLLSAPAHASHPNTLVQNKDADATRLGAPETSNERTLYKYIHPDGIKSCQLVMGLTMLADGSVWNTMPAHTHNRRMEVYLYFDVKKEQTVFHLMGEPQETRHLTVADQQAVISPPWSIHSGCGTANYSFIWGMAGENQSFADMDFVAINDLR